MKKVHVFGTTGFIGINIAESFTKSDDLEIYGAYQTLNHKII